MFIYFFTVNIAYSLRLVSYISSGGLHGEIQFEKATETSVKIRFSLETTLQYPEQQWFWSITEFPVDYTLINDRCNRQYIGKRYFSHFLHLKKIYFRCIITYLI